MSLYLEWLTDQLLDQNPAPAVPGPHVMGYATGYAIAHVAPFVLSLRAHFDGVVTLVVDDEPGLRAFLAAHDIVALSPPDRPGWRPHAVVERLAVFEHLLKRMVPNAPALLTDVRDVLFQADPLSPAPKGIEAFDESDGPADHAFNRKYMRALAGAGIAGDLSRRAPLCVGTVVGPAAELARLMRVMLTLSARPRAAWGGAFGADQASFNIAVHLGLVEAGIRPNFSRVATLGLVRDQRIGLQDGVILNPDGSASPIVHQYDRHDRLMQSVRQTWAIDIPERTAPPARPLSAWFAKQTDSLRRRLPELR